MKVVSKSSVYSQICTELSRLRSKNEIAEYIVVTRDEYAQLGITHPRALSGGNYPFSFSDVATEFKTWEFRLRQSGVNGPSYIKVAAMNTVNGVPLLVVPEEYHPL